MRDSGFAVAASMAAVLFAGCGGPQLQVMVPQTLTHSWMSPGAASGELLYVTDAKDNEVDVYAYPSMKHTGTLTGFNGLASLCVDKAGDVFIPNYGLSEILEFRHGGTAPVETLEDGREFPYGCTFDPKTGSLAVVDYAGYNNGDGDIALYAHAKGKPRYLYFDVGHPYSCAYDGAGDLFVEGYGVASGSGSFALQELAHGSNLYKNIVLDDIPPFPNGLQWNGSYLAVGTGTRSGPSSGDTFIYHVKISGSIGRTIGTTRLTEEGPTANFLINGSIVLVSGGNINDNFKRFNYPNGGSATKTIPQTTPYGIALSVTKR